MSGKQYYQDLRGCDREVVLGSEAQGLGHRIRLARVNRGLSQAALGVLLGVGQQAVSKYEDGSVVPDALMLGRIGRFLVVSVEFLVGG